MIVEFGEYLPDLADLGSCALANNCIPYGQGYLPFRAPAVFSGSVSGTCEGGISVKSNTGVVWNIAGTATDLYATSSVTWASATRISASSTTVPYTTDSETGWEFVKWGKTVIGVNGLADTPQELSISDATRFVLLTGSPPPARHVAVVGDFVVMGNLQEGGAAEPQRIRWSGLADSHTWASSLVTQADYQDIANGGAVQRVMPGLEGMGFVILENSTYRMVYEGLPAIFRVNEILPGVGTPCPGSVCQMGEILFFLSNDGFVSVHGGGTLTLIGNHKVDKTFWNDVNESYLYRMRSVISPIQKRVFWSYVGTGAVGSQCNKLLVYDWGIGRWSTADVNTEYMLQAATPGYTLDSLDGIFAAGGTSIDSLIFSLDSRAYAGGSLDVGIFDTTHRLAFFTGSSLSAMIETPEKQLIPGRRASVRRIRPVVDYGAANVAVGLRNNQSQTASYGVAIAPSTNGHISLRANARYHRFRATITGSWKEALGIDIEQMGDAGIR